jgi:hypothetical protein
MLHPQWAPRGVNAFVDAWLAGDPTANPSSAYADSEFRKDWVSANFTGGPLRGGGQVGGDDDSYSYGCAILFLNWLHNQQGYSMAQIVQNGGASLEETYGRLTHGRTDGF